MTRSLVLSFTILFTLTISFIIALNPPWFAMQIIFSTRIKIQSNQTKILRLIILQIYSTFRDKSIFWYSGWRSKNLWMSANHISIFACDNRNKPTCIFTLCMREVLIIWESSYNFSYDVRSMFRTCQISLSQFKYLIKISKIVFDSGYTLALFYKEVWGFRIKALLIEFCYLLNFSINIYILMLSILVSIYKNKIDH